MNRIKVNTPFRSISDSQRQEALKQQHLKTTSVLNCQRPSGGQVGGSVPAGQGSRLAMLATR